MPISTSLNPIAKLIAAWQAAEGAAVAQEITGPRPLGAPVGVPQITGTMCN
jgi:hypothetical protein